MPSRLPFRLLAVLVGVLLGVLPGVGAPPSPGVLTGANAAAAAQPGGPPPLASAGGSSRSARAAPPAGAAPTPLWTAPLAGPPSVTRPFDPPQTRFGAGHRGVDLVGAPGAVVVAAGDGVVVFAGLVAGRPVVSIDHAGGLRTTYEPVTPSVRAGQTVTRGSPIGRLLAGHPGCPAQACLHWGLRRGESYLDPLLLLRPPRVRLLPWGGAAQPRARAP